MKEAKEHWGDGPWQSEPDRKDWIDDKTGLPCMILRGPVGSLCGYVGVSERHAAFGLSGYKGDYDIDEVLSGEAQRKAPLQKRMNDIRVHGGITFAGMRARLLGEEEGDGLHWFGFDCSHSGDFSPSLSRFRIVGSPLIPPYETYKDLAYVEGECASLASQLAALGTNTSTTNPVSAPPAAAPPLAASEQSQK